MIIALVDGQTVVQVGDHRAIFPQTSFPTSGPSDEFLLENNARKVVGFLPHDDTAEKLAACDPYVDGDLVYIVQVEPLTPEEQQERIQSQWAIIRVERNARLAACDWTQLPDSPVDKTVWATYRQELRDITSQSGFPWDVLWPQQPA